MENFIVKLLGKKVILLVSQWRDASAELKYNFEVLVSVSISCYFIFILNYIYLSFS